MAEPATDLPLSDPFGQDALFLLDTYYKDVPELFLAYYPNARFEVVEGPGGQPLYLSVTVPGSEISGLQGLNAEYAPAPGAAAATALSMAPPASHGRLTWLNRPALRPPRRGLARSTSRPAASMTSRLDGPGQLWLDGQPWTGARFLGKGLHTLSVQQTEPGADVVDRAELAAARQG